VLTQINVSTSVEVFPHQKVFFFSRSGTTADGRRQQQLEQQQTAADGEEKRVTPGLMARDYAF
jgi:hypothetical protein